MACLLTLSLNYDHYVNVKTDEKIALFFQTKGFYCKLVVIFYGWSWTWAGVKHSDVPPPMPITQKWCSGISYRVWAGRMVMVKGDHPPQNPKISIYWLIWESLVWFFFGLNSMETICSHEYDIPVVRGVHLEGPDVFGYLIHAFPSEIWSQT